MKIFSNKKPLNILCLGAHSDDIEIGCGGSILKLIQQNKINKVNWIVFSSNEIRKKEAHVSANKFLLNVNEINIEILNFKDGFFPSQFIQIKEFFEKIKLDGHYDLIFTHFRNDRHQDHKTISDLTWNTFRNNFILEYEILKWDGDVGNPNVYMELPDSLVYLKNKYLDESFLSQKNKHWFSDQSFNSILRIRGIESSCKYAEAFYGRKIIL